MRPSASFGDDQDVRTTALIVGDHDDFRESASALLEAEGLAVVGAAARRCGDRRGPAEASGIASRRVGLRTFAWLCHCGSARLWRWGRSGGGP
jgi:hypothetical protein